jgi:hypothetical protein
MSMVVKFTHQLGKKFPRAALHPAGIGHLRGRPGLMCPRIISTDLDGLCCNVIDGPPASADHLSRLEEEGWRDGEAEGLGGLE